MVEAIAPLFRGQGGRFACSGCSGTDTAMRSDRSATATSRPPPRVLRGALSAIPHDVFVGDQFAGGRGWAGALEGRVLRTTGYPILALEGRSWDEILAATSPRFRKHVRQSPNRLKRRHDVRFRARTWTRSRATSTPCSVSTAPASASTRAATSAASTSRSSAISQISRSTEAGLRLLLLELDGEAVAAEFGFLFHGVYFAYQGARNPAWQRESVGFVLEVETIRRSLEEGAVEFRFLGGEEAYKYRFPAQDPRLETILAGRTARGRVASAALATAWRTPGGEKLLRRVASV